MLLATAPEPARAAESATAGPSVLSARPQYRLFGAYRLMLACLVLVSHGAGTMLPQPEVVTRLSIGNAGVFLFFILSGFVISEALEGFYPSQPGRFLANRLLRIVPGYWLALAVTVLIWVAVGHPGLRQLDFRAVFGNLLLFSNDLRIASLNIISISWSLIIEMEFYVSAALLYWLIVKTGRRGIWLALAASIGLAGHVYVVATESYLRFFAPLFYAPFFIFGAALHHLTSRDLPRAATMAVAIAAGLLSAHGYVRYIERGPADIGISLVVLGVLFALMLALINLSAPSLNRRDWQLGEITYLVYLLHMGVAHMICMWLTGQPEAKLSSNLAGTAGIVAMLLITFVLAGVLQRAAIRPLSRWRNRLRGTELFR